jgi:GntR family transcriptional regulator/MocR family aminotransferase
MKTGWSFPISLDPGARLPLFHQITRAIAADVGRGRLRPGDELPGSRALATSLGVHRSTVVTAYAELVAQGWATTRPAGATSIAATSPDVVLGRRPVGRARRPADHGEWAAQAGFAVGALPTPHFSAPVPAAQKSGTLALWGGVPDLRLVPMVQLGRALRRVARSAAGPRRALLGYTAERAGHRALRVQLARMLAQARGLAVGADDVFVTQGSQMALDLTARALVSPGDRVAVEAIGYRPAWGAFERAGALLVPIPVDGEGVDVEALAAIVALPGAPPLRAVHVTPQHQYPTTVVLSPRRRRALLALAQRHGFALVEDDYDHEFHYDGRPGLPLAADDAGGHVIYMGSLAKILAPGLRIGFVVGAGNFLQRLGDERMLVDRQGNHLVEAAVADLLEDGEIQRHARRARRIYQQRRDVLCAALHRHLGGALSVPVPQGGMALWARSAPGIDADAWHRRAAAAGVLYQSGTSLNFDGRPLPFLRLGFAGCDERELEAAARRLASCLPRSRSRAW